MERWKDVPGTSGKIQISDAGRARSYLRGRWTILKPQHDRKGYLRISVTINRKKTTYKVHRLVAQAYIDNPDGLPQVNHKDGDKENNAVSNLEWCTNKYNCHHAISHGLWKSVIAGSKRANEAKKTPVIAKRGSETLYFDSVVQAQNYFGSRHISDVINGKRDHVKGWMFERG